MNSHDLLLPAQSFHPLLQQGFTARQIDRHLQEIGVDQLHAAFLRSLLDLLDPLRLEVHNGDHIIDFGKRELVIGIVAHSIQMVQIGVGAINTFLGKSGQPPATGRMEVGHNKGFLGAHSGGRLPPSATQRHAATALPASPPKNSLRLTGIAEDFSLIGLIPSLL